MMSEWLKVMLEEIERKRVERQLAQAEDQLRRSEAADAQPQARLPRGHVTRI